MAGAIGILIAWGAALVAGWLERRRGWDIAAFFRGALLGFGIANLFAALSHAAFGPSAAGTSGHYANLLVLAVCVILGGKLGLSRLRSKELGGQACGASNALAPSLDREPESL